MTDPSKLYLKVNQLRPDFRVMISLLWSDFEEVDSEGEGLNPAERDWTDISIMRRSDAQQRVDIISVNREPLILEITSPHPAIASVVTYFLAQETNSPWSTGVNGPYIKDLQHLEKIANEKFNLKAALDRAKASIWRFSSSDNPYPNQRILKT